MLALRIRTPACCTYPFQIHILQFPRRENTEVSQQICTYFNKKAIMEMLTLSNASHFSRSLTVYTHGSFKLLDNTVANLLS